MPESLTVESLVESGVLVPVEEAALSLAPAFQEAVESHRDQSNQRIVEALESRFEESGRISALDAGDERTNRFAAQLCALDDHMADVPFETVVSAGFVVDQLVDGPYREDGVPDGFTPISGRRLPIVEDVFARSVVYVWLDDCEPCDAMQDSLESMQSQFPEDVARFAVFGPDSARYLHEEYDVQGGPATLFIAGGEVTSRLYGAQYDEVLESELASLGAEAAQ